MPSKLRCYLKVLFVQTKIVQTVSFRQNRNTPTNSTHPLIVLPLEAPLDLLAGAIVRHQPAPLDRHDTLDLQRPVRLLQRLRHRAVVQQVHLVALDGPRARIVKVHLQVQCVRVDGAATGRVRVADLSDQILPREGR